VSVLRSPPFHALPLVLFREGTRTRAGKRVRYGTGGPRLAVRIGKPAPALSAEIESWIASEMQRISPELPGGQALAVGAAPAFRP